ncbi:hypothetical protein ACKWTF_016430 [Chironomus riparius]
MIKLIFYVNILIPFLSSIYSQFHNIGDSSNPLSFGGNYTSFGECPWLCSIYNKLEYLCGSSLVTNQYVVTAAHCVLKKESTFTIPAKYISIYAGVYDLNDLFQDSVEIIQAQEVKVHPNWDTSSERYDADLALIKMSTVVHFSDYIQKIPLPAVSFINENQKGFVVGYGVSEVNSFHENKPRKIKIPIADVEGCYQNHGVFSFIKSRDSFCAGKVGVVPCNGDSGSSFYHIENSSPILLGIVSVGIQDGNKKCKNNTYVLFTDVFKFVDWIKKEVGSGYLIANKKNSSIYWKPNDAFCEYVNENGYRCTLRGVRSQQNDIKITGVHGTHEKDQSDNDVVKIWIIEQEAKFIPEMSNVVEKFKNIHDLRIWTCGLKFIERSKLSIFAQKLRVLDFFNNYIEEIPQNAFDDLLRLEELKILNNRIKHLPENLFYNLKNLKYFFAENNEIEELPARLFNETQIIVVSMKNNNLMNISVDFRNLKNVKVIDLQQNTCISQCLGFYCGRMSVDEMQEEIQQKCQKIYSIGA